MQRVSTKRQRTGKDTLEDNVIAVWRRGPLTLDIYPGVRGNELHAALAALQRIRGLWEASIAHKWFTLVCDDNASDLFAVLYHDFFWALELRPDLNEAAATLREMVPEAMPESVDALCMDDDMRGHYRDTFTRARRLLVDILIAEGGMPSPNPTEPLFEIFDTEIAYARQDAIRRGHELAVRLGLVEAQSQEDPVLRFGRSRTYSKEALLQRACAFLGKQPSAGCEAFLNHAGVSERTWARYRVEYGLTWSAVKQGCQKEKS